MKSIYIIEDDEITILILQKYIQRMGYAVIGMASFGVTAIKALKELKPDIILTDINLPGEFDGIEIITEIRKFSNLPVIFLTNHTLPQVKKRTEKLGNTEFLVKPFSYEELEQTLQGLLYTEVSVADRKTGIK